MNCVECNRLQAERHSLQRIHELAISNLTAVGASPSKEFIAKLRSAVDEAKLDLERVDREIARHRLTHSGPGN